MYFLTIFSIIILFLYCVLILSFLNGWRRVKKFSAEKITQFPFVSVVVAFRNEEKHITNLINDLLNQDYPHNKFEIVIINDHSEDNSYETAEICRSQNINLIKLISLGGLKAGKKQAIDAGIRAAKGELILTTDADCRLPQSWITSFISFFQLNNKPKMIIGLVDFINSRKFFNSLQNLEFLGLIGSGAGSAGIGNPIYCNAANLMFEKGIYFDLTDPFKKSIVSGDDTFLLHQVKKKYPTQIKVLKSKSAIVTTEPATSLKEFINQRIRWVSKGRHYFDTDIILTALLVSLSNIIILLGFIGSVIYSSSTFFFLFLSKLIIDWLMITPVLDFFNKRKLHFYVPLLSVVYPIYVFIMISGSFSKGFRWKGRVYKRSLSE